MKNSSSVHVIDLDESDKSDHNNNSKDPASELVKLDSPEFEAHLKELHFLRDSTLKAVRDATPRICLKCWVIISDKEQILHPRHQGHVLTGPFDRMQPAKAETIY